MAVAPHSSIAGDFALLDHFTQPDAFRSEQSWKVLSPTILVSIGIGMKFRTFLIITALLTLTMTSMVGQSAYAEAAAAPWPMFMADPRPHLPVHL